MISQNEPIYESLPSVSTCGTELNGDWSNCALARRWVADGLCKAPRLLARLQVRLGEGVDALHGSVGVDARRLMADNADHKLDIAALVELPAGDVLLVVDHAAALVYIAGRVALGRRYAVYLVRPRMVAVAR